MSNFVCPHCGMVNIDCGKKGYKTPREIELERLVLTLTNTLKELNEDMVKIVKEFGTESEE